MTAPLVTAVVPVYNGERFLGQALESILEQSYAPLEIVVVDDGSTDASVEIARRYPVQVLEQENRGVAAARNAGIAAATGTLLAFLDQDDVWLPEKLERQVAYLDEHPDVGFVHVWAEVVLEPGTPMPRWLEPAWLEGPHFRPLPSGLVIRRDAFESVGPFDTAYTTGADTDWLARAQDAGVAGGTIEEGLVRWRVHDANETHRMGVAVSDLLHVLKRSTERKRAAGRVSVIVPAYNAERYLAEALESALGQTVPPAEVIVVDDGSTDGTRAVAESFAPQVLTVAQENAGVAAARNHGVRLATGDFLAFLDADDVWEPEKLERQLAAFASDPGLELVFSHVTEFVSPELDPKAAAGLCPRTTPRPGRFIGTMLVRRGAFARIGPFATGWTVTEFLEWLLRAQELDAREAMLPECLARRRLHDANNWITNRQNAGELAFVLKESLDRRRARGEGP